MNISGRFSLSCLLAGALAVFALKAQANNSFLPDDNKDKVKTDSRFALRMPKTNLSLDAGYRLSGAFSSSFKLSSGENNVTTVNFKSVVTYTKGNVTYVVPYNFQVPQPNGQNFHKLQIILPLKKG